jgi:hypothetical protein
MKYTHAKCTFDNIELLVFYATFNKNSVISWWSRHIVFAPFLITSPRLLSGDVLLFYYYITPTVVLWCIAVLRFFFTIIIILITSPQLLSGDVLLFYVSFSLLLLHHPGWCIAILRFFFTIIIIILSHIFVRSIFRRCLDQTLWNLVGISYAMWRCAVKGWFLAHLTQRVMWAIAITWRPSSVCKLLKKSSPLKPLGQFKPNLAWIILRGFPLKVMSDDPADQPSWPPCL